MDPVDSDPVDLDPVSDPEHCFQPSLPDKGQHAERKKRGQRQEGLKAGPVLPKAPHAKKRSHFKTDIQEL